MKTKDDIIQALATALGRNPEYIAKLPEIEDFVDACINGDHLEETVCGTLCQTMSGTIKMRKGCWQTLTMPIPKKE